MPNFLYSTNTWLSYMLAEKFYGGRHFVWCTPYFEHSTQMGFTISTPPTSTPKEIFNNLALEVSQRDRHSSKIKENRAGLLKGARFHVAEATITQQQFEDIRYIVAAAEISDFRPLLYVINFESVASRLLEVPVRQRAHPLSVEFKIQNLTRRDFEVLDLMPRT